MKYKFILMVALFIVIVTPAQARDYEGVAFPEQVTLDGTDEVLRLNGVGMRTKFIFDIYIGALYTQSVATTREQVLDQAGPKRVHMHFLYDEVSLDKLVDGWNTGFEENQDEATLSALKVRIEQFNSLFTGVKAGDVVLLDYVPDIGTMVSIRGEKKGVISGADFHAALLDIWLGKEPADNALKAAMLGQE